MRVPAHVEFHFRESLVREAEKLRGLPCTWGGEDGAPDCSGCIRIERRGAGLERPTAPDYTSRDIWNGWVPVLRTDHVMIGDLALYGWPIVNHVMLVVGEATPDPATGIWVCPVIGASGARPGIKTIEQAKAKGAMVRRFDSHLYRNGWPLGAVLGFRGWRRMPEFQPPPTAGAVA